MARVFVVSDTHFNHANIIGYCNRPFSNVGEMDWELVKRWNAIVRKEDHVYHLGDVYMDASHGYIDNLLSQLNGHKRLILGNHDRGKDQSLLKHFDKVYSMRFFREFNAQLTHMPLHPGSIKEGYRNFHGHIHDKLIDDSRYVNVCVEHTDYMPVLLENIK